MTTNGDELGGTRQLVSDVHSAAGDVRLAYLLADDVYEHAVTRVFGVPGEQQTFLVKVIMTGAVVTVLGGYVSQLPLIRPSGADTAMAGGVLNAALRGIAGAPSGTMPAVGALIGFAVLVRSIRAVAAGSSRDVHAVAHVAHARYGHHRAEPTPAR